MSTSWVAEFKRLRLKLIKHQCNNANIKHTRVVIGSVLFLLHRPVSVQIHLVLSAWVASGEHRGPNYVVPWHAHPGYQAYRYDRTWYPDRYPGEPS
eukprot:1328969-Rhodomonas_salina.2